MPINRNYCTTVLLSLCALAAFGLPAAGDELTNPLSAAEVSCDERQLERLLRRMSAGHEEFIPPQLPTALLLFPRGGSGSYEGLVATGEAVRLDVGQIPPDNFFETYLSFGLESRARTLLLNPARPELAQVVLYRVSSGSNLVSAESWFNITLRLDPTLGGGDRLIINNLVEPAVGASYNGFLASSTKPGRGLVADGLLTSCHDKLTDFDRHVFSILQRTVRGNETTQFFEPDMEVAIFRGREPNVYRLNFYPIYEGLEESGRMAVELRLSWDDHGRLLAAQSVVLAACSGPGEIGCTSWDRGSLFWWLFHPLFGGREYYDSERIQFGGWFRSGEGPSTPRTLDLATLLTGSTWNEPVW